MKLYKRIFIFFITAILSIKFLMCYTVPVFASEGVYDPDTSWWDKFLTESSAYISYLACRVGAITKDHDFAKWVQTREDYIEWWNTGHISRKQDSNGNVNYSFDKELMAYIKQCLDEYIKTEQTKEENGGFYILPTISVDDIPAKWFKDSMQYLSFKGILAQKGLLVVRPCFPERYNSFVVVDPFSDDEKDIVFVEAGDEWSLDKYDSDDKALVNIRFYDSIRWKYEQYEWRYCNLPSSEPYIDLDNGSHYPYASTTTYNYYISVAGVNNNLDNTGKDSQFLCSSDGRKVRVFVSEDAAINYSVGKRKVFLTKNYYDYVPEDLEVSIDDLQKSVDDLQKIIDELLKRIKDDTSEKEIMDLLKQILEALKNQQGTGGGGSGSGGDVTVNVDLTETNGWLSKIYEKVTQIFEKISETAEGVSDSVHAKIQETLDEMLKALKSIRRWTIADTAVNAADAVADWLDFLKSLFDDVENGAGNAVAAISTSMDGATGLLKTKFPFCIPWDVAFLVTFLAHEPETPVFKLPIHVESAGIDECIEVDMSDFSGISTISRTLLMLIYCYGLLNLTMKIIPMAKEGT